MNKIFTFLTSALCKIDANYQYKMEKKKRENSSK